MYFVGIDISKCKHDCAIIDELGDVITSSWSFTNDCEGFSQFKQLLQAPGGKQKIGFESTGHYGQNLKLFLESNNVHCVAILNSAVNKTKKSTVVKLYSHFLGAKHRILRCYLIMP